MAGHCRIRVRGKNLKARHCRDLFFSLSLFFGEGKLESARHNVSAMWSFHLPAVTDYYAVRWLTFVGQAAAFPEERNPPAPTPGTQLDTAHPCEWEKVRLRIQAGPARTTLSDGDEQCHLATSVAIWRRRAMSSDDALLYFEPRCSLGILIAGKLNGTQRSGNLHRIFWFTIKLIVEKCRSLNKCKRILWFSYVSLK